MALAATTTNTTANNSNQQAAGQTPGVRRGRVIGGMGTGARLLVGVAPMPVVHSVTSIASSLRC
jgi:hypothetical protein